MCLSDAKVTEITYIVDFVHTVTSLELQFKISLNVQITLIENRSFIQKFCYIDIGLFYYYFFGGEGGCSFNTLSGIHRASTGTKYTVRGAICTRGARTLVVEESAALSRDLKKYIDYVLS